MASYVWDYKWLFTVRYPPVDQLTENVPLALQHDGISQIAAFMWGRAFHQPRLAGQM